MKDLSDMYIYIGLYINKIPHGKRKSYTMLSYNVGGLVSHNPTYTMPFLKAHVTMSQATQG